MIKEQRTEVISPDLSLVYNYILHLVGYVNTGLLSFYQSEPVYNYNFLFLTRIGSQF